MNRLFLFLSLLALALAFSAAPAAAAPVLDDYPPPELDYINAQLEVFLPLLADFQANYYDSNGVFFQALQSHSTPPEGVAPADDLYSAPTDQAVALATLWQYAALPAEIGWSLRVDTYYGPQGPGYVCTVETVIDGQAWARAVNVGYEDWRSYDWLPRSDSPF